MYALPAGTGVTEYRCSSLLESVIWLGQSSLKARVLPEFQSNCRLWKKIFSAIENNGIFWYGKGEYSMTENIFFKNPEKIESQCYKSNHNVIDRKHLC